MTATRDPGGSPGGGTGGKSSRHQDLPTSTCRTCGAAIVWTVTASTGKRMPVDAEPHPDGTVWLGGRNPIRAHVLKGAQRRNRHLLPEGKVYRSHFATCPDAYSGLSSEVPLLIRIDPATDGPVRPAPTPGD